MDTEVEVLDNKCLLEDMRIDGVLNRNRVYCRHQPSKVLIHNPPLEYGDSMWCRFEVTGVQRADVVAALFDL